MYYFVSLETIKSVITNATGLQLNNLTDFQNAILFINGNIFALLTIIFIISIAYKIIIRLIKFAF